MGQDVAQSDMIAALEFAVATFALDDARWEAPGPPATFGLLLALVAAGSAAWG